MKLLAIDPSVNVLGAAVFNLDTKRLFAARRFNGPGFKDDPWNLIALAEDVITWARTHGLIAAVVLEWPQVYAKRQRGRKDPNDLLPLAGIGTAIVAMLPGAVDTTIYRPHDWKGTRNPNPTARTILGRLDIAELNAFEESVLFIAALECAEVQERRSGKRCDVSHPAENTCDAIGIGLHHLGRLKRHRVIER